jgi:RNA polymerase sigma factor (sigma-70 family)
MSRVWNNSDEDFLGDYLFKYRGTLRTCGLEREDVAQDVRLSLLARPIPEGSSLATRRWNVRNRLIDVIHRHTLLPTSNGKTGAKARFKLDQGKDWGYENALAKAEDVALRAGQYEMPVERDPWLAALVDRLTDTQRKVIRLLYWGGAGHTDAARVLGTSRSNVQYHEGQALRALRKALA